MVNDDGPVLSPSPSSSSSATLLLLLIFATETFEQAWGSLAVLIMCTPISSGSLASLFEGDGDEIVSKSMSVTNLKENHCFLGNKENSTKVLILPIFFLKKNVID